MVDYNNETTISTPPGDILKVAILERRAFFINSVEKYIKEKSRGVDPSIQFINAALVSLFLELSDSMQKEWDKEKFVIFKKGVFENDSYDSAISLFGEMSSFLYRKNVTKFDTRKETDNDDIEGNNKAHGF